MHRIIMAVIVLAAVGIVSAFAASQVPSDQAGAAPSIQKREDQISLFGSPPGVGAGENVTPGEGYGGVGNGISVKLDPSDYPPSSVFR